MKLDEIESAPMLRDMVRKLWELLDDVDTMDDACKFSDVTFRNNTRVLINKRAGVLTSDGYNLYLPGTEPKPCKGCKECPKQR